MNIPAGLKNISIEKILIKENAGAELREFIAANFRGARGCGICDFNTEPFVRDYCDAAALELGAYHADEYMLEAYDALVRDKNYDYFIACGAGTIHDITRVIAHEYGKPFISFPTAASVDGFVSGIAPITAKSGMKLTLASAAPVALFADINIIAAAPRRLAASGMGDLLGKYTALADWRIANLLMSEDIDWRIIELEEQAIAGVRAALGGDYKRFCAELLEALVLSGLCMQSMGNSRPASGAEHHIAHFFEMGVLGQNDRLHGENVAAGTILCAGLYHELAASPDIKFVENYAADEDLVKKYYGGLSGEIMKENAPAYLHKITPGLFYDKLSGVREIIKDIPAAGEIREILGRLGEPAYEPAGYDADVVLKLAPYVRNRFTLLKLCRCLNYSKG